MKSGTITAVLGPNGSGKTTLIKSMLGLVLPEKGEIFIAQDSVRQKWDYRQRIGYLPQIARFPENLSIQELLDMMEDIRHKSDWNTELIEIFN